MLRRVVEPGVVAFIKGGFRSDGGLLAFDFDGFWHGEEEDGLGLGLVGCSTPMRSIFMAHD